MKHIGYIIATSITILLIVLGIIWYFNCDACQPKTSLHSYLVDCTDEVHINVPEPISVIEALDLNKNIFNGSIFRLRKLTAVNYTGKYEVGLKETQALLEVETARWNEVRNYYTEIQELLKMLENNNNGTEHSVILEPIASELEELIQVEADEKYLFIYSDLRENAPSNGNKTLNLYQPSTIDKLFIHPDDVRKQIEETVAFPTDLSGIHIYFIYQSNDFEEVRIFEQMAKILKDILEHKYAKVHIHSQYNPISDEQAK